MIRVLDAHGLMMFLEKESGHEKVEQCFVDAVAAQKNVFMAAVNYGEVYYMVLRECGQAKAQEIDGVIHSLPITIVDVDEKMSREAARFKAFHKMSYADCFAAALAKLHGGEVITGDKEFKAVEKIVKIHWID